MKIELVGDGAPTEHSFRVPPQLKEALFAQAKFRIFDSLSYANETERRSSEEVFIVFVQSKIPESRFCFHPQPESMSTGHSCKGACS